MSLQLKRFLFIFILKLSVLSLNANLYDNLLYYDAETCGIMKQDITGSSSLKNNANIPWAVKVVSSNGYICTGALISQLHVLVSNDCINNYGHKYSNMKDALRDFAFKIRTPCPNLYEPDGICKTNFDDTRYPVNIVVVQNSDLTSVAIFELERTVTKVSHACLNFANLKSNFGKISVLYHITSEMSSNRHKTDRFNTNLHLFDAEKINRTKIHTEKLIHGIEMVIEESENRYYVSRIIEKCTKNQNSSNCTEANMINMFNMTNQSYKDILSAPRSKPNKDLWNNFYDISFHYDPNTCGAINYANLQNDWSKKSNRGRSNKRTIPWSLNIYEANKNHLNSDGPAFCKGTLISSRHILAHSSCFRDEFKIPYNELSKRYLSFYFVLNSQIYTDKQNIRTKFNNPVKADQIHLVPDYTNNSNAMNATKEFLIVFTLVFPLRSLIHVCLPGIIEEGLIADTQFVCTYHNLTTKSGSKLHYVERIYTKDGKLEELAKSYKKEKGHIVGDNEIYSKSVTGNYIFEGINFDTKSQKSFDRLELQVNISSYMPQIKDIMSKTPIYKWFDEIKYIRNKRLKYYNYENCGTIETSENFQMVNFISNGEKVRSINDLPWAVQIISFGKFRCTGTMISRKHVLTAGHCLFSSKTGISYDNVTDHDVPNTEIVVSTSCKQDKRLQQNCKNQPGEKYKVRNFYRNPFYTSHKTSNDIMVLELQTEIPRMVHACLAFLHNDTFPKYDEGIVFGWGSAEYKKKWGSSHVLRKVKIFGTVSVVPTCMKDKSLATTNNLIGLTQLSGNKRPCSGDSGAGVIQANEENQHFVTGIVSHGIKCKEAVGQIADSYVYHRGLTDGYTCVSCFSGEIYDFMAQAED